MNKLTKQHRKRISSSMKGKHNSPSTEFKCIYNITKSDLETLYLDDKLSIQKIAYICGCSYGCIDRKIKKYNIITRTHSESGKLMENCGQFKKGCEKSSSAYKFPKGEEHPMWNDGSTIKNYGSKGLRLSISDLEKTWRNMVYERDKYVCQVCGQVGGELNAHHIIQFIDIINKYHIETREDSLLCDELWNINNGITLCKKCHRKLHNNQCSLEDKI